MVQATPANTGTGDVTDFLRDCVDALGSRPGRPETLPFAPGDATAGTENELQAAVFGDAVDVDLAINIQESNYFANIVRRAGTGDTSKRAVSRLERFLEANRENVWENSWVRFPRRLLGRAEAVFARDLRANKADEGSVPRKDADRFYITHDGEEYVRVPVSYLVKLALAHCLSTERPPGPLVERTGSRILDHFLNDNTSPETYSFHVVDVDREGAGGQSIAREAAKRYLLTQLLVDYANQVFGLTEHGQQAAIFASPNTPARQQELNGAISDAFYRELFMSPCLSGWDCGEDKRDYMHLCHQVLSRSHMNAVAKLRDAGIITRNLVVLPNTSNTSLANNGTHLSFGSNRLTGMLADTRETFSPAHEKYLGDLAIKISEHFLPLFIGTYSAAPYRIDFNDFHPERALGFLPHQLDYTHLRMLWRRWRGKARNRVVGKTLSPFGPPLLDEGMRRAFWLKGDHVPDFRLLDYPFALLSTHQSPALDGRIGNMDRLCRDLDALGVFDNRMAPYLPCRLRRYQDLGFSGFEGRWYSLFPDFRGDMAEAANLQRLLHAAAYHWVVEGRVRHTDIPDDPVIESERRQVMFATAIGIPTFYIRHNTSNEFLGEIVRRTHKTRPSGRYSGYTRVRLNEFRRALVRYLRDEAAPVVEMLGLGQTLDDLEARINDPTCAASGRLMGKILEGAGVKKPYDLRGDEFNPAAERYYRTRLRDAQQREALNIAAEDLHVLEGHADNDPHLREHFQAILGNRSLKAVLRSVYEANPRTTLALRDLRALIELLLLSEHHDALSSGQPRATEVYAHAE